MWDHSPNSNIFIVSIEIKTAVPNYPLVRSAAKMLDQWNFVTKPNVTIFGKKEQLWAKINEVNVPVFEISGQVYFESSFFS